MSDQVLVPVGLKHPGLIRVAELHESDVVGPIEAGGLGVDRQIGARTFQPQLEIRFTGPVDVHLRVEGQRVADHSGSPSSTTSPVRVNSPVLTNCCTRSGPKRLARSSTGLPPEATAASSSPELTVPAAWSSGSSGPGWCSRRSGPVSSGPSGLPSCLVRRIGPWSWGSGRGQRHEWSAVKAQYGTGRSDRCSGVGRDGVRRRATRCPYGLPEAEGRANSARPSPRFGGLCEPRRGVAGRSPSGHQGSQAAAPSLQPGRSEARCID